MCLSQARPDAESRMLTQLWTSDTNGLSGFFFDLSFA